MSQADWLDTAVEDLERHATTCAGCEPLHLGGRHHVMGGRVLERQGCDARATSDERMPVIARVPVAEGVPAQFVRDLRRLEDATGPLRQRGVVRAQWRAQAKPSIRWTCCARARRTSCSSSSGRRRRELHAVGPGPREAAVQPEKHLSCGRRDCEELYHAHDGHVHARRGPEAFHADRSSRASPSPSSRTSRTSPCSSTIRRVLRDQPRLLEPAEHVPHLPRAGADPQAQSRRRARRRRR